MCVEVEFERTRPPRRPGKIHAKKPKLDIKKTPVERRQVIETSHRFGD